MANPESKISLELSEAEAIVLFEFLPRYRDDEKLEIVHPSESRILWDCQCSPQKKLLAPLKEDYSDVLKKAREEVGE